MPIDTCIFVKLEGLSTFDAAAGTSHLGRQKDMLGGN